MISRKSISSKLRSSAKFLKMEVNWDETSNGFDIK